MITEELAFERERLGEKNRRGKLVFINLCSLYTFMLDLPSGASGKERACQEMQVRSLGWEGALVEGMAPTPVFLPGESHGQRSLVGYSPWGGKESDTTEVT